MANKHRKELEKVYNPLYSTLKGSGVSRDTCWYCGSPMTEWDHCPCLVDVERYRTKQLYESGISLYFIPSCHECNNLLGSKSLLTPNDRLSYLYGKYSAKLEKETNLWSDEEIEELGPNLKKMVQNRKYKLNTLIKKFRGVEYRMVEMANGEKHEENLP